LVQNNTERGFYIHSGSTGNNVNYNNIIENGNYNATSGGWEWQFYIDQYNPVEAKHNYWGAEMNNTTIDASIYDTEGGWGKVEFYPFETEPVTPENIPPIASFTYYPLNPIVNQMVTFNASNSADSDGTITNYEWNFGDGNATNTTEETITHFYSSAEDYTVNLTVTDDDGAINSTAKAMTVYPPTTIYVPDDYAKIQWAVDNASAGDTIFVWNGSYTENVNVSKRLTLEGEGADVVTVTAANSGDHVFDVTADYVNISGFAVRGATDSDMAGIYLDNADYCNISENNVYGNYRGILLSSSKRNTLANNTISGNHRGIGIESSSNYNTLTNNTVNSNHDYGIYLDHLSNYNTLENNTANSNSHGIYMEDSNSNVLVNNTVSDNGVGIGMDHSSNNILKSNTANSNNWGGICLWRSSNNTLKSNTANSNSHGIHFYDTDNNNITCNRVQNNTQYGFRLYNADNNNITCNLVQNNIERGFYIHSGSTDNDVSYNNIIENGNYNATSGGWEWQFYIDQYNPVEAKHNYWGAGMNSSTIDASIHDDEEGWGEVEFYPFETEPVPCAPGPERPVFTAADAVIALQIAAGIRPPDLCYDVSGDGSVTALDALMILQMAAGGIEIS
jgi:parallel beta-helix repeat protein